MRLAILRVRGEALRAVDIVRILDLEPDAMWEKGEQSIRGARYSHSGANFCVSDAETIGQLVNDIRTFASAKRLELAEVAGLDANLELDVGIAVGDSSQYTATLPLEASDLRLLADSGIRLIVSAYPTSDEANEEIPTVRGQQ